MHGIIRGMVLVNSVHCVTNYALSRLITLCYSRQSPAGIEHGGRGNVGHGRPGVEEAHLRGREGVVRTQGEEVAAGTAPVTAHLQAQERTTQGGCVGLKEAVNKDDLSLG